jgi:hypothetical protein
MDFNLSVEVWGADVLAPEKILGINIPGNELRIFLRDGQRKIGHLTVFRGNEPMGKKSPVSVDFIPAKAQDDRRKGA